MKTANQQWVRIQHPNRLWETVDVVPQKCDGKICEGIVISPGAGINTVTFRQADLRPIENHRAL